MIARKTIDINGEEQLLRSYEISLWTLDDNFISVLKSMNSDAKSRLYDPHLKLNSESIPELSFTIPMYINTMSGELIENPLWYSVQQGIILSNMRKIKVIFNKNTEYEGIFEFVITSVEETHDANGLASAIIAEGLAFHELGKQGFNIVLSADEFQITYDNWFSSMPEQGSKSDSEYQNAIDTWRAAEPLATLQYWNNLMGLESYPENTNAIKKNVWYYRIDMDWSSYANGVERDPSKIYEEAYVASWDYPNNNNNNNNNINIMPSKIERAKEKARIIDKKESNLYNLTQDIAEAFGVFCRYEYLYDINYHIIGKVVVYYNNFIQEQNGIISFSYPYSTKQIVRKTESQDLISKLYVKDPGTSNTTDITSIMNTEANKTKENYILNFDYLHLINTISDEQYALIEPYENQIGLLNNALEKCTNSLAYHQQELINAQADSTFYTNAITEDKERISNVNISRNTLNVRTGSNDSFIHVTATAPKMGILLHEFDEDNQNYYLNITEKGVVYNSLHIYKEYDFTRHEFPNAESNELVGIPQYDEFGNLTRIEHIYLQEPPAHSTVYLIYSYSLEYYYDRIYNTWATRLANDTFALRAAENRVSTHKSNIEIFQAQQNDLLNQKKKIIDNFTAAMGPALREGYWQPEDYQNRANSYIDSFNFSTTFSSDEINGTSPFASIIWDSNLFDNEQSLFYKNLQEQDQYYLCLDFSEYINDYKNILNQVSIIFHDFDNGSNSIQNARYFTIGSTCNLVYIYQSNSNNNSNIIPAIIIPSKNLTDNEKNKIKSNDTQLGVIIGEKGELSINSDYPIKSGFQNKWLDSRRYSVIYPRCKIGSYALQNDSDHLRINYNGQILKMFEDYYVLFRDDAYYITLKPHVMMKQNKINGSLEINYSISDASTSIYLDAIQVAKENSIPNVSYNVDLNILNLKFLHTAYQMLNHIVFINDTELKFEDVQGYISAMDLDLDIPSNDTIEVKNYTNKFKDLFSKIVASTESIQANAYKHDKIYNGFTTDGIITQTMLQSAIDNSLLAYNFNNNNVVITEEKGIETTSDSGVIAIRNGSIFVANSKDNVNNWVWNTAITPSGINPSALSLGEINLDNVTICSASSKHLQLNNLGLYAYRNYALGSSNYVANGTSTLIDENQYIVYNSDGIFLVAKPGVPILDSNGNIKQSAGGQNQYTTTEVHRVELSWDGLIIRNWNNENVFYADTDGNLVLEGSINCAGGTIANWSINSNQLYSTNEGYVALSSNGPYAMWAGATAASQAPFRLTHDGILYVNKIVVKQGDTSIIDTTNETVTFTSGDFTGNITINTGYIGTSSGLQVNDTFHGITGTNCGFIKTPNDDSDNVVIWAGQNINYREIAPFRIYESGHVQADALTANNIIIEGGYIYITDSGQNVYTRIGIKNNIGTAGQLYAVGANISGIINATSLSIAGNSILNGNNKIISSALADDALISMLHNSLDSNSQKIDISDTGFINGNKIKALGAASLTLENSKLSWSSMSTSGTAYNNNGLSIGPSGISITSAGAFTSSLTNFNIDGSGNLIIKPAATSEIACFTIRNSSGVKSLTCSNESNNYDTYIGANQFYYRNYSHTKEYFSISTSGITASKIVINNSDNGWFQMNYTSNNSTVGVQLYARQLEALVGMLQSNTYGEWSPDAYITTLVNSILDARFG